jgi:hypothetical protein
MSTNHMRNNLTKRKTFFVALVVTLFLGSSSFAEQDMLDDQAEAKKMDMPPAKMDMPEAKMPMPQMDMASPLGISMARQGSGTSWQPDLSPMAMIMVEIADWRLMFHGNIFFGFDGQGSDRGATQFNSTNWVMAMASHKLWLGQFSTRVMFSLEPLTVGGNGYPLLLQTGETWQGQPLHDRQHPHDLFMELAVRYSIPVHDDVGLDFYAAASGEPALGPVAFPHRVSARSNPFAPLGHHWYDSTHISFGVLTMGVFGRSWKLEGSWFNGREPDENRYDLDLRVPDSYSVRVSYNPIEALSMQASYGFLKSPEAKEPDISVHRVTTSVSMGLHPWPKSNLAGTLLLGMNIPTGGLATGFGLAEVDFDLTPQHTLFGRIEAGAKTGAELVLLPSAADVLFGIGAFSLGYTFHLPTLWKLVPTIGGVGTLNVTNSQLGAYYGGPVQFGGMVFLQMRVADHE